MSNPQYTTSISFGVGETGRKRREAYEKAAAGKPLAAWMREILDKAIGYQQEAGAD